MLTIRPLLYWLLSGGSLMISLNAHAQCPAGTSGQLITYDNNASNVSTSETWNPTSSFPGTYDVDARFRNYGDGSVQFHWNLSEVGQYEVYAWWPVNADANWATNAPFTITHQYGTSVVRTNQNLDGGQWNLLGTYYFSGEGQRVSLTNQANAVVVADAIQLVHCIVSNLPPVSNAGEDQTVREYTQVFLDGTGSQDADGPISSYEWVQTQGPDVQILDNNNATASFIAPAVSSSTNLQFRLTITDDQGAQHSDTVTVTVLTAQSCLPGQPIVYDDLSSIVTTSGPDRWNMRNNLDGSYGATAHIRYAAGLDGSIQFHWNLAETGLYEVYAWWPTATVAASNAPYTIEHESGTNVVSVNQQQNAGQWNLLGTFTFAAGAQRITLSAKADGLVSADAIRLVPMECNEGTDSTPPSVPTGLTGVAAYVPKQSSVTLSWGISTDDKSGIAEYRIYRDGSLMGTSTTTSYVDRVVIPSTEYKYQVTAIDNAGNESDLSNLFAITTIATTRFSLAQTTDIEAGANAIIEFNGYLYLSAVNQAFGRELWRTDGTSVELVHDINLTGSSNPLDGVVHNNYLYFTADDGVNGRQIMRTDGATATLVSKSDLGLTQIKFGQGLGRWLYFSATTTATGNVLWRTDGTKVEKVVADGVFGTASYPNAPGSVVMDGWLYFSAKVAGDNLPALWRTNGTTTQYNAPTRSIGIDKLIAFNGRLYFLLDFGGSSMFSTDGTDLKSERSTDTYNMIVFNNHLYYGGYSNGFYELWRTDGITHEQLSDFEGSESFGIDQNSLVVFNNQLYFTAYAPQYMYSVLELWHTNDTVIQRALPGTLFSSELKYLTAVDRSLFFTYDDRVSGRELWHVDSLSLDRVADIFPGADSSNPFGLIGFKGWLYFTAIEDATKRRRLWKTNKPEGGATGF